MLESLYNYSNELMELALAEEPIPESLIHKVLREATLHLQIQPVLCGSALHGVGVSRCSTRWPRICPTRSTCRRSKASTSIRSTKAKANRRSDS